MDIFETVSAFRGYRNAFFGSQKKIGLVPTMGALHEGHVELIKECNRNCDITVVTVFVNPAQFNNQEDLDNYPRTWENDLAILKDLEVNAVFHPDVKEIYTKDIEVKFDLGVISRGLEGQHRPGHFNGVVLIVSKLFNIIQPDMAFFGEKDLQQLQIIKKLASELFFPLTIRGVETVRDSDGLALSSRNGRLSSQGIDFARKINKGLEKGRELLLKRESSHVILRSILEFYKNYASDVKLEYCEIVDPETMQPAENYREQKYVAICVAAYVEGVRLIDNIHLRL